MYVCMYVYVSMYTCGFNIPSYTILFHRVCLVPPLTRTRGPAVKPTTRRYIVHSCSLYICTLIFFIKNILGEEEKETSGELREHARGVPVPTHAQAHVRTGQDQVRECLRPSGYFEMVEHTREDLSSYRCVMCHPLLLPLLLPKTNIATIIYTNTTTTTTTTTTTNITITDYQASKPARYLWIPVYYHHYYHYYFYYCNYY